MGLQNYHLLEALLAVEREGHCELAAQSLDTTVEDLLHRPVVRDEFAYLDFDDKGRFKEPAHGKEESSAFDMLDFFSLKQQDKRVIEARHKFARKRYFDKKQVATDG